MISAQIFTNMKVILVFLCGLIIIFLPYCQNQHIVSQDAAPDSLKTGNQIAGADSIRGRNTKLNTVDNTVTPNTTLDSLQGEWISTIDKRDHVKIISRQYIETYEGDTGISRNKIFFADTCIDDLLSFDQRSKLDSTRESGRFMVLADISDSSSNLCDQIDYVDDKHLVLIYHGKTLDFHK